MRGGQVRERLFFIFFFPASSCLSLSGPCTKATNMGRRDSATQREAASAGS